MTDPKMLDPLDVIRMDGHRFDFEIAHPTAGRPFRPEIKATIDVRTHRLLGFSVELGERA